MQDDGGFGPLRSATTCGEAMGTGRRSHTIETKHDWLLLRHNYSSMH